MKIMRLYLDESNRVAQRVNLDYYATKTKKEDTDVVVLIREDVCKPVDEDTFLICHGTPIEFT